MKSRSKAKFNIFAMLGWLVWKLLALFGSRFAKNKLDERKRRTRAGNGPVRRGLTTLTDRARR